MSLVGVGYSNPQTMHIAPRQITTFLISGASTILQSSPQRATQLPLPLSLGGFSAMVTQRVGMDAASEPLPLLEVNQINNCSSGATPPPKQCILTELTVQIPIDLKIDYDHTSAFNYVTTVTISDGSGTSQSFSVFLVPQSIHIISTCDVTMAPATIPVFPISCDDAIAHLDGKLVSFSNPAQPGEVLAMYALGLGMTTGLIQPSSFGPSGYGLSFAYSSVNSGGTAVSPLATPVPMPNPSFVGPVPGQVGLYQVNFTVPTPNGPISVCAPPDDANLRVTVFTNQWFDPVFDTARICVSTAAP
jgi:uncharacterized protein (TIGR03437 family)